MALPVTQTHNCSSCSVAEISPAAAPAIVQLSIDGTAWTLQPGTVPVHLLALFRDPAIQQGRSVPVVLDLSVREDGRLTAGRACWVRTFLDALGAFPGGMTIAIDNGVRCPCAIQLGESTYRSRAQACHAKTNDWHAALMHPDGKPPGIVICDKDLACALAHAGLLLRRDGAPWKCPARFVDAVGEPVTYLGVDALIGAHPVVVQRHRAYLEMFRERNLMQRIRTLARIAAEESMSTAQREERD